MLNTLVSINQKATHRLVISKTDACVIPKRQNTFVGCSDRQTAAAMGKDNLIVDLVEAFMAANILLEKLDNKKI
jgi:hypothetical protein